MSRAWVVLSPPPSTTINAHAVARTVVDAKLAQAAADRLYSARIAERETADAGGSGRRLEDREGR
jgi:hypothetical protein